MQEQLQKYLDIILNQKNQTDKIIDDFRQKIHHEVKDQINKKFNLYLERYNKHNKKFKKQQEVIKYYQQHYQPIKKNQLLSLFSEIQQKVLFNKNFINAFTTTISYPVSNYQLEQLEGKILLYQNYVAAIKQIVKNDVIFKNNKKETNNLQIQFNKYQKLIKEHKLSDWTLYPELNIKGTFLDVINQIASKEYIQKLTIKIRLSKGIMTNSEYDQLMNIINSKKIFLQSLKLTLTDMQFSQQKCDILKRTLTKILNLKEIIIQNFYEECKLGNFMDFNWHPLRKKVNIRISKLV